MRHELIKKGDKAGFCGHNYCPGNCGLEWYECTCGESFKFVGKDVLDVRFLSHRVTELEKDVHAHFSS